MSLAPSRKTKCSFLALTEYWLLAIEKCWYKYKGKGEFQGGAPSVPFEHPVGRHMKGDLEGSEVRNCMKSGGLPGEAR